MKKQKLTKDERDVLDHILKNMEENKTKAWYRIHGSRYEALIVSLMKKGILRWEKKLNGYVIVKEKEEKKNETK